MVNNKASKYPFFVFGEIVWDMFPDENRLGGAPLNFAYYYMKAGGWPFMISSVGNDELGHEAINRISSFGLDTKEIIISHEKPTGIVDIRMINTRHRFKVIRDTAWEYLKYPEQAGIIHKATGIYIGTLARVSENNQFVSNRLITDFAGKVVFLDVNLRMSFYSKKDLGFLLKKATHLKMNLHEAKLLKEMGFISAKTAEGMAEELIYQGSIKACCITLGEKGAIGADRISGAVRVKGMPAKKGGDSVGAGDSFAGFFIHGVLSGLKMEECLFRANQIGALVASHKGAIIELDNSLIVTI